MSGSRSASPSNDKDEENHSQLLGPRGGVDSHPPASTVTPPLSWLLTEPPPLGDAGEGRGAGSWSKSSRMGPAESPRRKGRGRGSGGGRVGAAALVAGLGVLLLCVWSLRTGGMGWALQSQQPSKSPANPSPKSTVQSSVWNHQDLPICPPGAEDPPPRGPGTLPFPAPFLWFSARSADGLQVVGPAGDRVPLESLGRFHGKGDFVFSYQRPVAGEYKIMRGSRVLKYLRTLPGTADCPREFHAFEKEASCSPEDLQAAVRASARFWPGTVDAGVFDKFIGDPQSAFVHVVIVGNALHFRLLGGGGGAGEEPPLWAPVRRFLLALLRRVQLPDVEFLFHGQPRLMQSLPMGILAPTLSFSTSEMFLEVPLPSPTLLEDIRDGTAIKLATAARPWAARRPQCFFRGRAEAYWGAPGGARELPFWGRGRAALLGTARRDILSVGITDAEEKLHYLLAARNMSATKEPQERELDFRCLLEMDGEGASWSFPRQLATGATVLKQQSPFRDYFHEDMQPGHHFVQVDHWLGNLERAATDALGAPWVAEAGFQFFLDRLQSNNVYCYTAHLLRHLRDALSYAPQVRKGMVKVPQPEDASECQS